MPTIDSNRHAPVLHMFTVKLQTQASRADTRRFFRRMQADMARAGLIMNYTGGLCLAVKAFDENWRTDRHLFVNWLIDQPESFVLVITAPADLRRMLEGKYDVQAELAPLDIAEETVARWLISKVLTGLVTRAINHLQIGKEA